ncbi:MAG: hypothetical protein ABI456_25115 [Ktedonobacteraceae bacterium]
MQQKHHTRLFFAAIALTAILISVFGSSIAFAAPASSHHANSGGGVTVNATRAKAASASSHSANLHNLPTIKASSKAASHKALPVLTGLSAATLAQRKAAATHNTHAPRATAIAATQSSTKNGVKIGFQGMADSATICPYFMGCAPPDMAWPQRQITSSRASIPRSRSIIPTGTSLPGQSTRRPFSGYPTHQTTATLLGHS